MTRAKYLTALAVVTAAAAGCSGSKRQSIVAMKPDFAHLTVRFVAPQEADVTTTEVGQSVHARLASVDPGGGFASPTMSPFHAVLWGGPFNGDNVTFAAMPLEPGPYVFGLFDQDHDAVYQGWMNVNKTGDDTLNLLREWREVVREEQQWLGFEQEIRGTFASRNPKELNVFMKQLRSIQDMEHRLDKAIKAEERDMAKRMKQRNDIVNEAEVLLMPGESQFFRPSTQPTFREAELDAIRGGQPVTKVVMVADYDRSMAKVRRVAMLRRDLQRGRTVAMEEVNRLRRLKGLYGLTDHLYHHDKKFVQTERRLQEGMAMIDRIDQRIDDAERRLHALMFVSGLFAPDASFDAFDAEQRSLQRERVVVERQKRRVDQRIDQLPETSRKRVALERERQTAIGAMEAIDAQIQQLNGARVALNKLRNSTQIIHRFGPAYVLAASMFDRGMPAYLASAIENEALLTVRLQTTDSLFTPNDMDLTSTTTASEQIAQNQR
ncbi:MAG: hypothetical protein ACE5EX_00435 [Phycisphaerae bacterium]